jgi:predicted PurR-regulated permease PerM
MQTGAKRDLQHYTNILLFLVLSCVLLYAGRLVLIPLSFAFLISFMYYPVGLRIEKRFGRGASIFICLLLLLVFGFLLFQLLLNSVQLLKGKFVGSQEKAIRLVETLMAYLDDVLVISPEQHTQLAQQLYEKLLMNTMPFLRQAVSMSASMVAVLLIVPIFVALILYYRELLVKFTLMVVPQHQVAGFTATIREIAGTYFKFAKGMAIVYLVVGAMNSVGFALIGLPNPVYFGVLAALLTFFPYVGIMIGGLAAVIVAWTTYDSLWQPFGVVLVLGVVQYLEANVIFPLAVGQQLRINALATLIAILIGGVIWGGAGMVLFVPFAAILKILADHIPELRPLGVLLGPAGGGRRGEEKGGEENRGE